LLLIEFQVIKSTRARVAKAMPAARDTAVKRAQKNRLENRGGFEMERGRT
jgi:hypothetical protein